MKNIKYKFFDLVGSLGIFLEYSYRLQGHKLKRFPNIGLLGCRLANWSNEKKDKLNGYPQEGWGWIGSELDGLDVREASDYIKSKK